MEQIDRPDAPALLEKGWSFFARGECNFRDDDSHWNPTGVRCAAHAIAEVWKNLPAR